MGKKKGSKKGAGQKEKTKTTERNAEERAHEIEVLRGKLEGLELSPDRIPEIGEFFETQVQEYLEGSPSSGSIKLVGCKRILHYRLTLKKMHEVAFELKFDDNV